MASLGAEQVIDYRESPFEKCASGLDIVFDTVGGDTLERSWAVLKPSGRMVTVVSTAADSTEARVKQAFFIVEPNQKQLVEVGALLDSGRLRTAGWIPSFRCRKRPVCTRAMCKEKVAEN